jgi:hypothetical protein
MIWIAVIIVFIAFVVLPHLFFYAFGVSVALLLFGLTYAVGYWLINQMIGHNYAMAVLAVSSPFILLAAAWFFSNFRYSNTLKTWYRV